MQALFTDTSLNTLSSHMLPLCRGINGDIHINRKAFYEKFLTGFIMPPNTLFEEVIEIDRRTAERISNAGTGIRFITSPKICINTAKAKSFQECLKEQAETLHAHFESLWDICEGGVDIGLSGGYDSRLVLACLHRTKTVPIHLHSHSTENDHKKDLGIAQKMADYIGIQCHTIPTKKLSHSDNTDEILKKSVLYFDGRSSFSIGGCGEVYTASYRESSTENTPFTLTGIGGELYRNVFDIGFRKIRFDRFMRGKVFSSSFRKAIPDDKYREICSDVIERAAERLDIDKRRRQSKAIAHRYYCEIMMPNGQGAALDAYNQVSCCTAPFLEPAIITKGYETIPFHHSGGDFEGKLIERIDQGLAAIPSSYGYPIASRPITARIKEALRTYIPASLWEKLVKALKNKPKRNSGSDNYEKLYVSSRTLKEAYAYMADLFPEINFSCLLHSGEDIRRVQFIAMTLYMSRERIKTK